MKNNQKIKMIDLFAGCGGLSDGFMQTLGYEDVAAVEWKVDPVLTLRKRLKEKWGKQNADESVMLFDIQKEEELFGGWVDNEGVEHNGLDYYINQVNGIDAIIGGPPCQAYSIAGRVRDENGMQDDYRNYLFEHYLSIVKRYQPDVFIFENVPGILSAAPKGKKVSEIIPMEMSKIGYEIISDLSNALVNASEFGVPQVRRRVVLLGLRRESFNDYDIQKILNDFYYCILPKQKKPIITVKEAIGDLPRCMPLYDEVNHKKRLSHKLEKDTNVTWHKPRYVNLRDMATYNTLARDIESGERIYDSKKIAELYEEKIGSKSPIHRYHVLEAGLPSTTIIAHLKKDGHRFIHYDSLQSRTITPREAARLQSFDDDFDFVGSTGSVFEMIGNAVPVQLAKALGLSLIEFLKKYKPEKYA